MANKPSAVDGYCYFTIDDGKFYIDVATATQAKIGTNRIPINAKFSDIAKTGLTLPYTVCNSAASLISKEITIATEGWTLQVGSMIAVYFANANSAANPTLCVNGGDPIPIYKVFGKKAGGDIANSWDAGSIIIFFYTEGSNGSNKGWVMANWHDPQQMIDAAIAGLTASQAVSTDANKKLVSTNLTVSDPTASGTGITYIASISQSAVGKITATKSTVRNASTSQTGVVQLSSATNSTSETLAATAKAVKTAYDLANTANTTANNHKYWANIESTSAATYNKAPEVANIKINGNTSASAASTKNVQLTYDSTLEVLNFVFS